MYVYVFCQKELVDNQSKTKKKEISRVIGEKGSKIIVTLFLFFVNKQAEFGKNTTNLL